MGGEKEGERSLLGEPVQGEEVGGEEGGGEGWWCDGEGEGGEGWWGPGGERGWVMQRSAARVERVGGSSVALVRLGRCLKETV